MEDSFVSVIVPAFNSAKYLVQAIDSVVTQDYHRIEVVVVDDGSTDDTAQIIGKYERIRYIYQTNRGVASARNTGIHASQGEIIAFLDGDDCWPPNRLTLTVRYLDQHPAIGYVLGRQMMFVEPGSDVPPWVKAEWLVEPQDVSNTGVLVVRREIFERIGAFNEDYRAGEDTEWLVRAREAGIAMARLPEVVLYRRIHGENLSTEMFRMRKANLMRIIRESLRRQGEKGG